MIIFLIISADAKLGGDREESFPQTCSLCEVFMTNVDILLLHPSPCPPLKNCQDFDKFLIPKVLHCKSPA